MSGPMEWMHSARMWFRATFARRSVERDLEREMATHLEMEREKLEREGVPPDEAARRARLAFGGVQRFAEDVIDERGTRPLDNLVQDVRFALRHFRRAPVVTAVIVGMLALGIGANSLLFALVENLQLMPPKGVEANSSVVRIRGLWSSPEQRDGWRWLSYAELAELRRTNRVFAGVAGWFGIDALITPPGNGDPVTRNVEFVTGDYFSVLGIRPALGVMPASFRDDGSDGYAGVVVAYRFWTRHLGAAPDVIGKSVRVGNALMTIAAVAPPGFSGAQGNTGVPVWMWLPLPAVELATGHRPPPAEDVNATRFFAIAKLQSGVSLADANRIAAAIGARSRTRQMRETTVSSSDVVRLRADNLSPLGRRDTPTMLLALSAVTLLILAIVCTNVGALVLGRAATRQREIGVRLSLGATRARLIRQLLTESAIIALAGGAVGLGLLAALLAVVRHYMPDEVFTFGAWTIAATGIAALLTAVMFGLTPALHATRTSVGDALKQSGGGGTKHTRLQRRLVVTHIALCQPALVGLGLLLSTALQSDARKTGDDVAERTIVAYLRRAGNTRVDSTPLLTPDLKLALGSLPTVERVADGVGWTTRYNFEIPPSERGAAPMADESFRARVEPVGEGYFDLLNLRVVAGREFDRTDIQGAPLAAIVADDLARELWGDANPIGRTLRRTDAAGSFRIVGVVDAAQAGSSFVEGFMRVYVATAQYPGLSQVALYIRTSGRAEALIPAVSERIRQIAPRSPIFSIQTVAHIQAAKRRESLLMAAGATGGGLLALLLASIGLYAVVAFAVAQRTREIGIRIALGARRGQIIRHFARDGLKLSLIGSVVGLPASVFAVRAMLSGMELRGVSAWGIGAGIAATVTTVAMFATWLPARRAARVDPITACRAE